MKKALYLCLFVFCMLTCLSSTAYSGTWLTTECKLDNFDKNFNLKADGVIDSATCSSYYKKGNSLVVNSDYDCDGEIDEVIYSIYGEGGGSLTVKRDTNNDGDIDYYTTYTFDENCFLIKTCEYDADWVPFDICHYTNDSNGNPVKTERDEDADNDIDSTTFYTYDETGNCIKEEKDLDGDGNIDDITNSTYNERGEVIYQEIFTEDAFQMPSGSYYLNTTTQQKLVYTHDKNGNPTKIEVHTNVTTDSNLPGASDTSVESYAVNYKTWEYFENIEESEAENDCGAGSGAEEGSQPSKAIISGTVSFNGNPVCAMVLANGKYMFTCSGDGSFNLNDVAFDSNGQITLFVFCSGLAPYKTVMTEGATDLNLSLSAVPEGADAQSPMIAVETAVESKGKSGWIDISGSIKNQDGDPLCAMVLANGQYTFTCNPVGKFSLTVPKDSNGQITILGFCSGLSPTREII